MNRHQQILALYDTSARLAEFNEKVYGLSEGIAEHYFDAKRKRAAEKEIVENLEGYREALREALKAAERIKS